MQPKCICLGLFAAFAGMATAADAAAEASNVMQLTKDTFQNFIEQNEHVLVKFYAPWCGHCKALAPEYELAANSLMEKNIRLAKVDCTEEEELCKTHNVEGYPTLKFIGKRGDVITPYSGQRNQKAIHSFMVKQSMPAVSTLDAKNITDFKTADKVVVIAYFDADDESSAEKFNAIAEKGRNDYLYGHVADADVAKADGVKAPAVVVYKSFDEGKNIYKGKEFDEALEEFIKNSATPLIGEIGPETYSDYMSSGLPLAYIFAETEEERTELAKILKPVAEKHKGKINMGTIDAEKFGAHAGNLNLESNKFPALAIEDMKKNHKFPFDQEKKITEKDVGKFVADFLAGKIEPSVKSEPIPESQDGPVTIIVAKNYDEIVKDNDKDVLVEFYAPWCGHCKALAPKYDELGEAFKKSEFKDKVVIAKVDATANDVPDDISGFPTIKLFPAGDKENAVTYNGARTVEDLAKFVEENGKHKAAVTIKDATEDKKKEDKKEDKEDKEDKKEEKREDEDKVEDEDEEEDKEEHDEL